MPPQALPRSRPRGRSEETRHANPRHRNDKTNELLKAYAASDSSIVWIDLGAQFLDETGWVPKAMMADEIHPTDKGYEPWAAALKEVLKW